MSNHAWILLGLFLVVLFLTVKPLGTYIANVMDGRFRLAGKIESPIYRLCGIRPDEGNGLAEIRLRHPAVQCARRFGGLCLAAPAGRAAPQSAGFPQCQPGFGVQYRHQFRHQHQLAGLWRRSHDELSDPDAGPRRAKFLVGRHRHRRRHRTDPRLCSAQRQDGRQRLGRSDPDYAACAAADFRRLRGLPDQPGRHPEFRCLQGCDDAGSDQFRDAQG